MALSESLRPSILFWYGRFLTLFKLAERGQFEPAIEFGGQPK
jgi:hypothetical protein